MADAQLEAHLLELVRPVFPGITVSVEDRSRWNRPSVTFTWPGFADLLPEERYHKLIGAIPHAVRDSRMKGFVWLELASDESIDDYMRLPRSEDAGKKEPEVYSKLVDSDFFAELDHRMGTPPENKCGGDFSVVEAVLSSSGWSASGVCDAKLVFIRHGVYCDCQVLSSVQPQLVELYSGAA